MAVEVTVHTSDGGAARRPDDATATSRWWTRDPAGEGAPPPAVHGAVVGYVQRLQRAWSRHAIFDQLHERLYSNQTLRSYHRALAVLESAGYSLGRLLVTTSIVDTFVSRFSKRRPRPMLVVDEAEWLLKQQALDFRRFLDGKLREAGFEELRPECIADACRVGSGIVYVDDGPDDVVYERVKRRELFVDPFEARAGAKAIRQLHRVRRMAREVLCEQYPKLARQIMDAPPSKMLPGETGAEEWTTPAGFYDKADVIDVHESWHLPSAPDAGDGRRARCLEGATLCFEEWTCPRFPFAILRRHLRPQGFWGQGDVERLAPLQHDINLIARDLQQNIEVGGKLYLLTGGAADQQPTEKLIGVKPLRVRGALPNQIQFIAPTAIAPVHQQILDSRIEYAYRFAGVADWSATARSPLGAGASGVAIDTMEDLQSDRHAAFELRLSAWSCDVAQLTLDAAARVAERLKGEKRKYEAVWMEAGTLERLAYDKVKLDEGKYRVEIEATSYLPTTRAGKLAALKELVANGYVPQWAAAASFEEPDIAHVNRIVLAKYHNAERMMQALGRPDKFPEPPVPEPYHDLDLLLAFAVAYYNRAQADRAPNDVQLRYAAFIDLVNDRKAEGASPGGAEIGTPAGLTPPGASAMPGMTPPGAGLPPDQVPGGAPPMMAPVPMGMPPGMPQ